MNTCKVQNQIGLYLDGELTGEALAAFEAHLEQCETCRDEVEQYRGLLRELGSVEQREVPPQLTERLHVALVQEAERGKRKVGRKFNPWALTAAAAVVVCLIEGGLLLSGSPGLVTDDAKQQELSNRSMEIAKAPSQANDQFTTEAQPTAAALAPAPEAEAGKGGDALTGTADAANGAAVQDKALKLNKDGLKLIYTANYTMETRDFTAKLNGLNAIVAKYGGHVEQSQTSGVPEAETQTMGRNAFVTLRLPVADYTAATKEIEALGNVLNKSEGVEDVSRQYVDTEARNKTLTLQRDKLYELMTKADSMESVIALENEIARITTEIEQMTSQLKFWDDKVADTTITVELRELVTPKEVKAADPDLGSRMKGELYSSLNRMKKGAENFAVGFMGALPVLLIVLVLGGALVAILLPVLRKAFRNRTKTNNPKKSEEE